MKNKPDLLPAGTDYLRVLDVFKPSEIIGGYTSLEEGKTYENATVLVTPERLREVLDAYNISNRDLIDEHLRELTEEVTSKRFKQTGDPMHFGKTRILNWQHRGESFILANKPATFNIRTGLEDEDFEILDRGKIRSNGQALAYRGVENASNVAAAAGWFETLRRKARVHVTPSTVWPLVRDNPGLADSARLVGKGLKGRMAPSLLAGLHYRLGQIQSDKADAFLHAILTGEDASSNVRKYRDRALKEKISDLEFAAHLVKIWNADLVGKPLPFVKWVRRGQGSEAFPDILAPSE